jgi:hypothetical protein
LDMFRPLPARTKNAVAFQTLLARVDDVRLAYQECNSGNGITDYLLVSIAMENLMPINMHGGLGKTDLQFIPFMGRLPILVV